MPTPEELARQNIDALLQQCGWLIQDYKKLDLSAGRGIAIREVRLREGRCDYLLLIDRKPVSIIEAKKAGVTLSTVASRTPGHGRVPAVRHPRQPQVHRALQRPAPHLEQARWRLPRHHVHHPTPLRHAPLFSFGIETLTPRDQIARGDRPRVCEFNEACGSRPLARSRFRIAMSTDLTLITNTSSASSPSRSEKKAVNISPRNSSSSCWSLTSSAFTIQP